MAKIETKLFNTSVEDAFKILYHRLQSYEKSIEREKIQNDYPDGIARTITFVDRLGNPYFMEKGKIIFSSHSHIMRSPSLADLTAAEIVRDSIFNNANALVFAGFQTQVDVLLEVQYDEIWRDLVDSILSELHNLFPEPKAKIDVIAKTYQLYRPIDKGNIKEFYGRLADYTEDNKKRPLYHFATTPELLNFGRARITFGINGDAGDIAISTDNGYLHLKAFARDDLAPLLVNEWALLYAWFVQNGWLPERESNNLEIEQRPSPEKRSIEFDCPQDELLKVVNDLYHPQNKWPQGYHLGRQNKSPLGDIELQIDKELPLKQGEPLTFENNIGHITIGTIGSMVSTLSARSHNPDLLQCFDELIMVVAEYKNIRNRSESAAQTNLTVKNQLPKWKMIVPNKGDDWQILELWDNNHTNTEIGKRFHKAPRTITNRISTLRLRFPDAGILKDDERRKRLQKS